MRDVDTLSSIRRRDFLSRAATLSLVWATQHKLSAARLAAGILPLSSTATHSAGAPRHGGTLRVSVSRIPKNLNPMRYGNQAEYMLGEMFYNNLVRLNGDLTPVPDLAESWSSNSTLTEWTFRLREGIHFHHGPALTAEDVAATFHTLLRKETLSPARRNIGPIEDVTILDNRTIRLHLSRAYGDQAVALAYPAAKILPAHILTSDKHRLDSKVFGTGPFRMLVYDPTRLIIAERNPTYFRKDRPYLARVEQHVFKTPTQEIEALLSDKTDLMLEVPSADFDRVTNMPNIEGIQVRSGRFFDLVMANNVPPFNDLRVRKALQLSLDREALVRELLNGYGIPGGDTPIMAAYPYYSPHPSLKPDVGRAKALLADAGYQSGIKLTLIASDRPAGRLRLADAVSQMAQEAGFNIRVQNVDSETYLRQIWNKANFYIGFYNMQPSEGHVLNLLYTSTALWNQTRWNNVPFDKLVESALATIDIKKRAVLYEEAQGRMRHDVPSIIPFFMDLLAARRSRVAGLDLTPLGVELSLNEAWIDDSREADGQIGSGP